MPSAQSTRLCPFEPPLPAAPGERVDWHGLYGASRGLAVASAALTHSGPIIAVVPDAPAGHRLETELAFFLGAAEAPPVLHFPDWETLPYDLFSPHQDIVSDRLETLYRLPGLQRGVLVVPVTSLMVRTPPRRYVEAGSLLIALGDRLETGEASTRLDAAGYRRVGQVMEHGEFAIRGSLVDMFPMGSRVPFRIDLLDDEVESIRTFDPDTQRTSGSCPEVRLLPAREMPFDEAAIRRFRQGWRARFEGDPTASPVYRDVSQGLAPAGIEYYLPLFFEATATLLDYFPPNALVLQMPDAHHASETFWGDVNERYEQRAHDRERPVLPPAELFLESGEVFAGLKGFPRVRVRRFDEDHADHLDEADGFATRTPTRLPVDARAERPFGILERFLADFDGRVLFLAESPGRRETLLDTLRAAGITPPPFDSWNDFLASTEPLGITVAALEDGAVLLDPALALIAESQLFGERAPQSRRRRKGGRDAESVVRDLTELAVGAPVVHEDHGVGRYHGLQTLTAGGLTSEFLCIEYADGDKLYVPVASLHLVGRYTGSEPDLAPLHKLGGPQWQRAKRRAAEKAYDVAAELLDIYARRASRPGHAFEVGDLELRSFEQAFPFDETPDQQATIAAVLADMASDRAMDRLVCGDVGFGKTEVAMRAAFVAVAGGRQAAILVPTTLLAQQHHTNFVDRFADWPVRIESLSRFQGRKERDAVIADLASGKVDIVIGTHQLLQDGVHFARLGLVVIDEEHRFGVRQKERLKRLRAETDVLTLTATPIPRTLNMALSGMRDLSLIATPPARRLSIKTFVREWNNVLIREAVLREIRRGGQVYFVHNKVEDIEKIAADLRTLVSDARVEVAHGQMRERDLERVMLDFYHRRFNVLVCTTIIETGIDVPSANTIVINRADRFGLAQLHQLRGRVGRSHHRAYAYLVVPDRRAISADAIKRLEAIESLEDLGIGFTLATHDLEIRGAGELLGEGQSGQIQEVGYSLYTRLLERAVAALRAGRSPQLDRPLDHGAEVDIGAPALIPEDYLPDVHSRLIMYKRIASAETEEALVELREEMVDWFGLAPLPVHTLFQVTRLKLRATPLGVRKIEFGANGGRIMFGADAKVDPARVIRLIQADPATYRLDGSDKLRVRMSLPDPGARLDTLGDLLDSLTARDAA